MRVIASTPCDPHLACPRKHQPCFNRNCYLARRAQNTFRLLGLLQATSEFLIVAFKVISPKAYKTQCKIQLEQQEVILMREVKCQLYKWLVFYRSTSCPVNSSVPFEHFAGMFLFSNTPALWRSQCLVYGGTCR